MTLQNNFYKHIFFLTTLKNRNINYLVKMNVKLKKSAEILLRTRLSVAAVAAECGFENPNHFSARFASFFGMPPTVYRERNI